MIMPASKLCQALERALVGEYKARLSFESTSASLEKKLIEEWMGQEKVAMAERGTALRIFDVNVGKGETLSMSINVRDPKLLLDYTQDNVQLSLTSRESTNGLQSGSIEWIVSGIEIEDIQ